MSTDSTDIGEGWPAAWTAALSDDALLTASSAAVFARGRAYARSGAVGDLEEDPMPEPALRATVIGTSTYNVEVWIEADALAGQCDCPHASDGWFCKHQVAVALVWRQRLQSRPTSASPSTVVGERARAPRTALEKRQALHAFLHDQDAATLAEKLLELAARDHGIERELQQWRKLSRLDDDWPGVRRIVSAMLAPGQDFIAWNEGENYVARASAVLKVLRQAIARDPIAGVSLAMHALREVWAVIERADDSDGAIARFCGSIGDEFIAALRVAPNPSSGFAEAYLALRIDGPLDAFDPRSAEAAMGATALGHYRQTLRSRWRQAQDARSASRAEKPGAAMPTPGGCRSPQPIVSGRQSQVRDTVERLHLEQLVQTGEVDEALAVLRSDLTTAWAHRRVVRFLEEQGRYREAFAAAEAACRLHPDDRHLEEDVLRCYERDGWTDEALAVRQRQFEREPSVERYRAALVAGAAAGRPADTLREALFEVLQAAEQRAVDTEATRVLRLHARGPRALAVRAASSAVPRTANVSLRASILCSESRWLEAWAVVQPPNVCSDAVLQHIARHLPATHHREAVQALKRVLVVVMRGASSPYREALELVADIVARLPAAERSAWLRALRAEFKAKRNFIGGLPAG